MPLLLAPCPVNASQKGLNAGTENHSDKTTDLENASIDRRAGLHLDAEQVSKLDLRNIIGDVLVVLQVSVGYIGTTRRCRYVRLV